MTQAEARLQVRKLSETAHLPVQGSKYSAGFDLHASVADVVPPRG